MYQNTWQPSSSRTPCGWIRATPGQGGKQTSRKKMDGRGEKAVENRPLLLLLVETRGLKCIMKTFCLDVIAH